MSDILFNKALIQKYNLSGPRYTSYPTAVVFHDQYQSESHLNNLKSQQNNADPLSLYIHIPFCDTLCFFCACNKIATKRREKADVYLDYIEKEMALQSQWLAPNRPVEQLHFGGGTPTFLTAEQLDRLMTMLNKHFHLIENDERDYSIELDPRQSSPETIQQLSHWGFNRFSMGIQDINPVVQKAVNRVQPMALNQSVIDNCRKMGAKSINVDLIYGLPHQTVNSFDKTLDAVIGLSPDRLSVFNYAHMPHLFKPQQRILSSDLPSADEKLAILDSTITKLQKAGYEYIGMDHFAKPNDELAKAQKNNQLHRNFQGYTTHADCDMLALGVSAISHYNNRFSQNSKDLDSYYEQLDQGNIPIIKGYTLDHDDQIRRDVIQSLSCHFHIDKRAIGHKHNIRFEDYFAHEIQALAQMQQDGLLTCDSHTIRVTEKGRLLIRNICMVFDRHLRQQNQQRFSKVI